MLKYSGIIHQHATFWEMICRYGTFFSDSLMSTSQPEAFLLLALPNATIRSPATTESGVLNLKCVNVGQLEHVFLVLSMNTFETPIDPCRVIHLSMGPIVGQRTYAFDGTDDDPSDLVLTITSPPTADAVFLEDLETFDGILAQYADFRHPTTSSPATKVGSVALASSSPPPPPPTQASLGGVPGGAHGDLRGQLILVNEKSGEMVGSVDKKLNIYEDPILHERGHENDVVIIEVPEGQDVDALEIFARAVPPEEQDWMTKSATVIRLVVVFFGAIPDLKRTSHAISSGTNVLLTSITSASSYYISKTKGVSAATSHTGVGRAPLPPRVMALLGSPSTRRGLQGAHAASERAVQITSKTTGIINSMISRAVGGKPKGSINTRSGNTHVPQRLSTTDKIVLSADLILSTLDESAKQILGVGGERLSAAVGHTWVFFALALG